VAACDFTLAIMIALLVPALSLTLQLKCLLHLSASHVALAAELTAEIRLALFKPKVYSRFIAMLPLVSQAMFA